jgi:hypothetical protein
MNTQKIFFLLALLSILLLLFIAQSPRKPLAQGAIQSIKYGNNRILIKLHNTPEQIVIFENKILPIKINDYLTIYGQQEVFRNQTQIIADKITKNSPPQ